MKLLYILKEALITKLQFVPHDRVLDYDVVQPKKALVTLSLDFWVYHFIEFLKYDEVSVFLKLVYYICAASDGIIMFFVSLSWLYYLCAA